MKKSILFLFMTLSVSAWAADHYVSPSGSGSTYSEAVPGSLSGAFAHVSAGDRIICRAGTYTISTMLTTGNSGSSGSPITVINYPGETPTLSASGLSFVIRVDDPYWIFDGLTINHASQIGDSSGNGIIGVGSEYDANHTTIQNCTLTMTSSVGHDNLAVVSLKGSRCSNVLIQNCTLTGQGLSGGTNYNCGVQAVGFPGGSGYRILNNNIIDNSTGIMIKHINSDTSLSSGAEIAYNYIKGGSSSQGGVYGNPAYMNIHDNLIVGAGINFGDNGGDSQGNHSVVDHNTCTGSLFLWSPSEGPITDCTFTNNIFTGSRTLETYNGDTSALNTFDYNMWSANAPIGASDFPTNSSPTYTGGATPSTVLGYALTSESVGYQDGSDNKDVGADVSLVGPNADGSSPAPAPPTLSNVTISGGSFR